MFGNGCTLIPFTFHMYLQKVSEIWEIMKYMVNVKPFSKSQNPLRERSYKHQFVEQSKKYLENRYKVYMSTVIADHLRDAQRGGIPSTLNLVSSFVGLKFNNPDSTIGKLFRVPPFHSHKYKYMVQFQVCKTLSMVSPSGP